MIPPLLLLATLLVLTALAWAASAIGRGLRRKAIRRLASEWHMRYAPADLFNLARQIGDDPPVPGAADLRVRDVIYGSEGQWHRYLFTIEYTCGGSKQRRERRVIGFREPREPREGASRSPFVTAPPELDLLEQYARLQARQQELQAT